MLFNNDYESVFSGGLVAESSCDYQELGSDMIMECAAIKFDISDIMTQAEAKAMEAYTDACGNEAILESQMVYLAEAAKEGMWQKVKNFFKRLLEKLKAFWNRVVNWFALKLKSNDSFIKEYEKKKGMDKQVEIKCPDYAAAHARLGWATTIVGEAQKAFDKLKSSIAKGKDSDSLTKDVDAAEKFANDTKKSADKAIAAGNKKYGNMANVSADDVSKQLYKEIPSLKKVVEAAKASQAAGYDLKGQKKALSKVNMEDVKAVLNSAGVALKIAIIGKNEKRKVTGKELLNQLKNFNKHFGDLKKTGNFIQNTIARIGAVFKSDVESAMIHLGIAVSNLLTKLNNSCVDASRELFISLRTDVAKAVKLATGDEDDEEEKPKKSKKDKAAEDKPEATGESWLSAWEM